MEVHPPEHPIITWKQFFVHMATIVLGLLIAIGLEQSVEKLHQRHERKELREAMARDLEQIRRDCAKDFLWLDEQERWNTQWTKMLQLAVDDGHSPAPLPQNFHAAPLDLLADASFDTAKANGRLALLSDDDVSAYNELDTNIRSFNGEFLAAEANGEKISAMYLRFGAPEQAGNDWERASAAEKSAFVELNAELDRQYALSLDLVLEVYGAATALQDGERDLPTIYAEERKITRQAGSTLFTRPPQEPKER